MMKNIKIIMSVLLMLSLVSCFHNTGGDGDKNPGDEGALNDPNNSANDTPDNSDDDTPNNNGNQDNNDNSGNEAPVVVVPKPIVPAFTVTGTDVTLDYGGLELGYSYIIYFYADSSSESRKAQVVRTPVLTESLLASGPALAAYVASVDSAATSLGLDLTKNQTVYIRIQADAGNGNVSELSEPKQIKYLAAPAEPDISTYGNEITAQWLVEPGVAYSLYYRYGTASTLDQTTLVEGSPFTTGSVTFTADACEYRNECSVALVAEVEGSTSAPVFVNRFPLTPTTPAAPSLSTLGVKMTVKYEEGVRPVTYPYDVYVAKEDFSDIADAYLIGSLRVSSLASTRTWTLPDAMGLDLLQDQMLYIRVLAKGGSQNQNLSALSDVQQIKYLAPPTDVTNITSVNRDLTIEWPVEAGKAYKAYIQEAATFDFRRATLVGDEPFIDGVAETSCMNVCSIGITVVEGNAESAPIVVPGFYINLIGPRRTSSVRLGEQIEIIFTETQNRFSVYYSTASPVTANDVLLYDSEVDGVATTIVHDISAYYSAEGEALTYYYGAQSLRTNLFTNPAGTTKEFYAYSPVTNSGSYAPALNDFKMFDGAQYLRAQKLKIADGLLYSSLAGTNQLKVSPLNGDASYSIPLSSRLEKFEVELTDKNTVYYVVMSGGAYALHKVIKSDASTTDVKVDFPDSTYGYRFVDMVQSATHIYLLTNEKIMKIAKASIGDAGTFEVSDTIPDSITTAYVDGMLLNSPPTDLAISEDGETLYMADSSGVHSLPEKDLASLGGALRFVTTAPASLLAVNGSDLYFADRKINGTIKKISLAGSGNVESIFQEYVTHTQFLKSADDWLYFTSGNTVEVSTYRKSLLDGTLERVAKLRVIDLAIDTSENGEGVYLVSGLGSGEVYHFPESYYSAPPLPPSVGELTTTPGDTTVWVKIVSRTPDAEAFGYEVNGVETTSYVTGLPNGIPADIVVTAYNISGPSESITVTDTPIITVPRIIDTEEGPIKGVETGVTSGELAFYIKWINPIWRDSTLKIYRSLNADVDTSVSENLLSTIDLVNIGLNPTHRYRDTELTDGQFYYYRVVLSDDTDVSSDSNEAAGMPYAPYSKLTDGAPLDGNLVADGSTLYWMNYYNSATNPAINSVIKQYVSGSSAAGFLLTAAAEYIAPKTTQLVAGFNKLYGIGSDNRVVEIDQDFTEVGIFWKETLLTTTSDVMNQALLSGVNLYLSGTGKVISISTLSGDETVLYESINAIENLVEDSAYLYWLESGTEIKRVLKIGGVAETLITGVTVESFDVYSTNFGSSNLSIFYSVRDGGSFTISRHNVADETTVTLTEESLHASFALSDAGEVYVAARKVLSNSASYEAFVKIDFAGIESIVRVGVPAFRYFGGQLPPKLLSVGNSVYFTLPIAGIYKIQ